MGRSQIHNTEQQRVDDRMLTSILAAVDVSSTRKASETKYQPGTQAELDSHANMICLGKHCTVLRRTGRTVRVNAFADSVGSLNNIPVVDAVVVFDDPYGNEESYFLVMYNALYIPSMNHHLIPPFLLREAGLLVNDMPKIHSHDPDLSTHTIFDPRSQMKIHLKLNGIFSYFKCRAIAPREFENWQEYPVVYASPKGQEWNPYNTVYAEEEACFLNHRGELREDRLPGKRDRPHLIGEDEDTSWHAGNIQATYMQATTVQEYDEMIESNFSSASVMNDNTSSEDARFLEVMDDHAARTISSIDSCLIEDEFIDALESLDIATACGIAAGSTHTAGSDCEDLFIDDIGAIISAATGTFSALASGAHQGISAERLSKIWRISEDDAQRTVEQTTQLGRNSANTSLSREFPTNDRATRYKRFIDTVFYTDTMFVTGKAKSTRGYTCVQVYVSDKGFVYCHLMKGINSAEYMAALKSFCKEVGVPERLVCDPHRTQTSNEVRRFLYEVGTTLRVLERGTQWANLAERIIGMLKSGIRADLRDSNAPMVFWDYCLERRVQIMNLTARSTHRLGGLNPYTATKHESADISNIATFGWFEWCYCLEDRNSSLHKFPHAISVLGRCLGPAKDHGNEMAQWVLKRSGRIVPLRSLRRLTPHELSVTNEDERDKRILFMNDIRRRYGDSVNLPPVGVVELPTIEEETQEDLLENWLDDSHDMQGWHEADDGEAEALAVLVDETLRHYHIPVADICNAQGQPVSDRSMTDLMIGIEVLMPHGEEGRHLCKVLRKSVDAEGKTTGIYDEDPSLNTLIYDIEFPDGHIEQYGANMIAQNVLEQVEDHDGHYSERLKKILDHRREGNAVSKGQMYITTREGQKKLRRSTVGWKFLVEYHHGGKKWMQLSDLKETNPVDVAEYVTARKLEDEVAFQWWVPYTLRKKARIIAAVKSRVKRKTHKYGIEIPQSVEDAFRIDRENGNNMWQQALALEMNSIGVAISFIRDGAVTPPGLTKTSGHVIFDVKMDFRRKARWVLDGHKTPEPTTANYAGVVSRESVRIAFTYAAMMGLPVMAGDIKTAYLQAPTSENHYIICGPEFGMENEGKRARVRRAIYGGRVSGRDYWLHLRKCMDSLGFSSSKADSDVWFRSARKTDGTEYIEYVLLYVDDILVISEHPEEVLRNEIGKHWQMKEDSIGKPSLYLGGKCREVELDNGVKCWAFSSSQYVQSAVDNVKAWLAKKNRTLPNKAEAPFASGYRPEVDVSRELVPEDASYFQSLIGVLRWIVELGRVDICLEVSMMSSHLALPREGHLECLYHMFAYLGKYHNAEMLYDPTEPQIDPSIFKKQDWTFSTMSETDRTEVLPPDMPEPKGKPFVIRCFVDADHAGDAVTRKSRTGFIVYLNNAPIYWYSKRQGSVESSTYQAEFTAMKEATEYIRALRYRLRMMGIRVEGPAYIFGDNQSVLANTTNPGSVLKKKCAAVAYHLVREGVARGEWITAYINTHDNIADLLTKPMTAGAKRNGFIKKILQHIFRKE